ncbi:MAG: ergothioneine biosynthesis protein EgtB [Hyphococcus sp.]|nr:MAG: ergothioneine biosynthesis protein EgtB [Marinicaulis sp.]
MAFDSPILTDCGDILARFTDVRTTSTRLAAPLTPEDWMLQSMQEASPVKWNLAHTSWFFETFLLQVHDADYEVFHADFCYLFNSYYNQIGKMHPRPDRGLLSRPTSDEVMRYRAHVDEAMTRFIEASSDQELSEIAPLIALGLAHEEQHQELLLTDLKHALSLNPLLPGVYDLPSIKTGNSAPPLSWEQMEGGLCEIGWNGKGFAFDNEGPRHKVYLHPFELANRPVTAGEYIEFIEAGGYENPNFWLSDAWELIKQDEWCAPLYWRKLDGVWREYTLHGERPVNLEAPVCHVSSYEAAAYASWVGTRLPTEFEWEAAASLFPLEGKFLENGAPDAPQPAADGERLTQLFGDVWEWTASPYVAYPGFNPPGGAIGEYNGKFMSGQMVLRGGSCATPKGHMRLSYRNFFPPDARWQFSGFRLARDCG